MCTLTWWSGPGGYEVFFNRDERRTRLPALVPARDAEDGVRFVAPKDANAGGTWLLANEHGVTLAILNRYEEEKLEPEPGEFRSRGLLLRGLAPSPDLEAVAGALDRERMENYNAFTLLGFDQGKGGEFRAWSWMHDRTWLQGPDRNPSMPVCSSSHAPQEVVAARKQVFADLQSRAAAGLTPEDLDRFHHDDGGGHPSAETVLMRREDARTWSVSRVRVGKDEVRFDYEDLGAGPDRASEISTAALARAEK